ncbi:MAG: hypothetical protein A3J75_07135 [Acidobacteria bacterium RBG_16_68_9]|nr:MAG: hypothetical protein A3J75_07135 [Acidobacteria bacterium RBG_16_68_9]
MKVERRDIDLGELTAILDRVSCHLSDEERDKLKAALDTLALLATEIGNKGTTIERLRRMLFGAGTEKTEKIFPARAAAQSGNDAGAPGKERPRAPGHGRNGADAFPGAVRVCVPHATLHHGDRCPQCLKGKLYLQAHPALLVRIRGVAPLSATRYECERLRCSLCGDMFTAEAPAGVGEQRYDETATAMVALLKYGCGLPFNRIEKLERNLGIPLPAATQWELVAAGAAVLRVVLHELIRQAAQGEVLHNDDTTAKILEIELEKDERTGVYTSGIVSNTGEHQIALFFTGTRHAGENLAALLEQRAAELPAPIQMCDALAHNTAGEFETIVANCIAHARRQFVEVAPRFPEQCRYVLEALREVYRNDAHTRTQKMSAEDRLAYHQEHSAPHMRGLLWWLYEQIELRKVEPNSSLGGAIKYMRKHWHKLTLFLQVAGAPLDNNVCERILKKAILHRLCGAPHSRCYAEIGTMRS